ncbi:MAG: hypothetical protein OEZ06_08390 [Myxococcales bacterium]|nr:hypothetical protein [Myxococcales bacterium]
MIRMTFAGVTLGAALTFVGLPAVASADAPELSPLDAWNEPLPLDDEDKKPPKKAKKAEKKKAEKKKAKKKKNEPPPDDEDYGDEGGDDEY